jgi:hypothetical protein
VNVKGFSDEVIRHESGFKLERQTVQSDKEMKSTQNEVHNGKTTLK